MEGFSETLDALGEETWQARWGSAFPVDAVRMLNETLDLPFDERTTNA